jgi:NAD(P)-dependent dehydrogenase (short-subunit alcohol dehydrogenase family)
MAGKFAGKVVMVTGATGNLGSSVARKFAGEGAKLALVDRNAEVQTALIKDLGYSPENALGLIADLTNEGDVDAMVRKTIAHFGQIDVLAHTVGGYAAGQPVHESGIDTLEKMWNLNVRPVYLVCGRVAKHMVEQGVKGRIVVVLARAAVKGSAKAAAYTASKAAALRIVESMAAELLDQGITVNSVLPSTMDTPPNRQSMPNADFSKWVTTEQMADAIAFLASDEASAISGVALEVYGRS